MLLKSYPTIITHSVSAGALLCDATTANAFIAPTGIDFTPYRGKQIEIWSGSTLWARAWVSGTAPTGDGAGAELLEASTITGAESTMDGATSWLGTTLGAFSVNGTVPGKLYMLGNGGFDYTRTNTDNNYVIGSAIKISAKIRLNAGSAVGISLTSSTVAFDPQNITPDGTEQLYVQRMTAVSAGEKNIVIGTNNGFNGVAYEVDDVLCQRILDPASTGALLLSSNGGSRGYAYKHASFNPNAAVTLRVLATRVFSGNGSYIR